MSHSSEPKTGILSEKLKTYYEDVNVINYRNIFCEALLNYRGMKFRKVLDIGSGVGSFLDSIQPFGFDMYALEASDYGLKRLKDKKFNYQKFNLELNKRLPFEDKRISCVVFNQVIEHVTKEVGQYYLPEIIRILEPGGVAIIKSPSLYCRIWSTDPHHIYCWRPNELYNEVSKYKAQLLDMKLHRIQMEPWMLLSYNENIINKWHKHNKHPIVRAIFKRLARLIDFFLFKTIKTDAMLAASNVTFVKSISNN